MNYIKILFMVTIMIAAYIFITDDGKTTYEQIKIQHGDTLWTLAERYKGDLTTEEWIRKVKAENKLTDEQIIAGKELTVPISETMIHIAIDHEEIPTTKVASQNNEYEK
jgi:LysM repeat protein